jgi:hypothetical protein
MTSMTRRLFAIILLCASSLLAPCALTAQQAPPKQDPAKALKALQDQLDLARKERLALEARLEKELADEISARARLLAMGGEAGALQRLELLLDSAQARLLVQRDRIRLLKDATEQTQQAVLVVLVRAEALPAGDVAAVLLIDGAQVKSSTYTPEQAKALAAGAADELYRSETTAAAHTVRVQIAGRGFTAGESIEIPAAPKQVTYVEFVLKNGRLVSSTWTNKAAMP